MTKYYLKQENHTSLKCNNSFLWLKLLGIKLKMRSMSKVFLPNSDTSTWWELYPNSQKMILSTNASNKYKMRRDDLNKLVVLSHVIVQYSYWPQMTLTLCCQAQTWLTDLWWKRSLARCLAAMKDFSLVWSCHQEDIVVKSNYFNWPSVREKAKKEWKASDITQSKQRSKHVTLKSPPKNLPFPPPTGD